MMLRRWGTLTVAALLAIAVCLVSPAGVSAWQNEIDASHEPPPNDDFADATIIPGGGGPLVGSNVGSGSEAGEPDHAGWSQGSSVWWRWTAPAGDVVTIDVSDSDFDTVLGVYTGTAVDDLTEVASDDDCGDASTSAVSFMATGGVTYHIAVDGFWDWWGGYEADQGTISGELIFGSAPPSPANDDFGDAVTIPGEGGTLGGTNCFATYEPGEPGSRDTVWWSWTAPADGTLGIDLGRSGFDTYLAVYTGDTVDDLTLFASNDDYPPAQPDFEFYSVLENAGVYGGTTYRIAVSGSGESGDVGGSLGFSILTVPNDFFSDAEVIPAAGGPFTGSNDGASLEAGEAGLGQWGNGASVWWRWTAPDSGMVTIDLDGSDFDNELHLYTGTLGGTGADALTQVAYNAADWGDYDSRVSNVPVTGGAVYHFRVNNQNDCWSLQGCDTYGGSIVGELSFEPEPPVALCAGLEATIVGTDGDDTIYGTRGRDVIAALDGNDMVWGRGGDDVICGGDGGDTLQGNSGNDLVLGGDGDDLVLGGNGDDTLRGQRGDDELRGGFGADKLNGSSGDDLLKGGRQDDRLDGGAGTDTLNGGLDSDMCIRGETTYNCEA